MSVPGARQQIDAAVMSWTGVASQPHRFGGVEYRLGRRELGHIHGDHLVDIPFPRKVRDEVVAAGQAQAHHVLPASGWVSLYLREPADVETAIQLLRRSYELAPRQRDPAAAGPPATAPRGSGPPGNGPPRRRQALTRPAPAGQ